MKKKLSLLLSLLLILMTLPVVAFGETAEETVITILGTSDLHGRIYPYEYATDSEDADAGLAKVATVVKTIRNENPNTLLFDCGDTLQDNSAELFNENPVHPMIEAMNLIGYDGWVVGNHEFNFGLDFLNKNIAAFEGDVLAANIYNEDTQTHFVAPYALYETAGVRVAVVGMMPPNVPIWEASTPDHFKNLEFTDVIKETEKTLKALEGQYDVLVGAYHIGPEGEHGYDGLETVAEKFPEFDVIFGGHAHSKYTNDIGGVKLIEPGRYGWAVAKSDIALEKTADGWNVVSVDVVNVETQSVEPDAQLLETFKSVHERSLEEANKVVGQISEDFIERPDYYTGEDTITTLPTAQVEDTAIIDLINAVQMHYAESDISSAALFNFGSNLKAGPFKKKDVAFIYKYDNTLMGVNITGENLLKYMEWSAAYYNTYAEGDLTISFNPEIRGYNYDMFSGIDYRIDISKPVGERITEATIKGAPIDDEKVYKLAVNNYRFGTLLSLDLVTMADKYYDSYEAMQDAGRIRDLIIAYTQEVKNGALVPSVDDNWSIIGTEIENSPYLDRVKALLADGTLTLPTSEDGRTLNVKPITVEMLKAGGYIEDRVYEVQRGDVLWRIAEKYKTTWQTLQELNALENPNLIFPGQNLVVPM